MRDVVERYEYETVHLVAKGFGFCADVFMYGMEPLGLLLFMGDVVTARAGAVKLVDAHKRVLARVQHGEAAADEYHYETTLSVVWLFAALRLMGGPGRELQREFLDNSVAGAFLVDDAIHNSLRQAWEGTGSWGWKSEDGHHCCGTMSTFLLILRAFTALLEGGADEGGDDSSHSRGALRQWLPSASELLRIAEHECMWNSQGAGVHPALLCATLHGERLGQWQLAAEVAEGVLRIEAFNSLLRVECHRLLGRANAALGRREEACKGARRGGGSACSVRVARGTIAA